MRTSLSRNVRERTAPASSLDQLQRRRDHLEDQRQDAQRAYDHSNERSDPEAAANRWYHRRLLEELACKIELVERDMNAL